MGLISALDRCYNRFGVNAYTNDNKKNKMKAIIPFYLVFLLMMNSCVGELENNHVNEYSRYVVTMKDFNNCIKDAITFESFVNNTFSDAGVIRSDNVLYINIPVQDEKEFLEWVKLLSVFYFIDKI